MHGRLFHHDETEQAALCTNLRLASDCRGTGAIFNPAECTGGAASYGDTYGVDYDRAGASTRSDSDDDGKHDIDDRRTGGQWPSRSCEVDGHQDRQAHDPGGRCKADDDDAPNNY